jgi:hypothetical protein
MKKISHEHRPNATLRKNGLRAAIVLFALGGFCLWRGIHAYWIFLPLSAYNLLGALFCPPALAPLEKAVMALVFLLNRVVTFLVMVFAFFCVFTPIACIGWIMRKPFLDYGFDPDKTTYWIKREKKDYAREDYERQF